jgi:hypothetical protein
MDLFGRWKGMEDFPVVAFLARWARHLSCCETTRVSETSWGCGSGASVFERTPELSSSSSTVPLWTGFWSLVQE